MSYYTAGGRHVATVYYTYMWLREDGTPYYVGKGHDQRAFRDGHPCRARILVQHWASEQEAFEMEKYYVKLFGRKDLGTGILRNRTDGGEGTTGPKTEEHVRKIAAGNRGKRLSEAHVRLLREVNTGRRHTPETRQKHRVAMIGKKYALGYKLTEEQRRNSIAAHKGVPWTPARRAAAAEASKKVGAALRGRSLSAETKQRISAAHKERYLKHPEEYAARIASAVDARRARGFPVSPEHRAAISRANKGRKRPCPPEHRAAISAGLTGKPWTPERKALHKIALAAAAERRRSLGASA